MTEPDIAYLREQAWQLLAPGFVARADVVAAMRELAEDDVDLGVHPDAAETVVGELWQRRLDQLATPAPHTPTDDDRVGAAFTALTASGLVAELDCGFDQGEASGLCASAARERGAPGYVFAHRQDVERLAYPGATLHLGFDAVPAAGRERFASREEYDAAAVAVGHRVAQAMVAHGLAVRWDATAASRIELPGLDWRRPLPA